jgi:phage replication-related protein YjqB (UPF0714/DUF867 family)
MKIRSIMKSLLLFATLLWGIVGSAHDSSCTALFSEGDKYANYSELIQHEVNGTDFRIVTNQVNSSVTIIAPHAGLIEIGTSEIARAVAGNSFNLYLFEGLKNNNNFSLHITSDHFDEPQAMKIMTPSELGISIHGYKDDMNEAVLVGGRNKFVAASIVSALHGIGIAVEFPSIRFKGESLDNIVNRARKHGVQLEISSRLRKALISDPQKLQQFANAIRSAYPL